MLKTIARKARNSLRALLLRGETYRCPVCVKSYMALIDHQICPGCGSYERHRILWLYLLHLEAQGRIKLQGKLLHIAPEACLAKMFKRRFDYLSVDRERGHAMEVADITSLPFADGAFDAVICNHVLEHVAEDRTAMAELQRVLKPGGWASLQVPMRGDVPTDEDPTVVDPAERLRRFGQEDHVRLYGYDYAARLQHAGFEVETVAWQDFLHRTTAEKCRAMNDPVIIGWKRAALLTPFSDAEHPVKYEYAAAAR